MTLRGLLAAAGFVLLYGALFALARPGPAWSGTVFAPILQAGSYPTNTVADMIVTQIVHVDGGALGGPPWSAADPNEANLDFLDMTSHGWFVNDAEVYVRYFYNAHSGANPRAFIEVLAWGCTAGFPCTNMDDGEPPCTGPGCWVIDGPGPGQLPITLTSPYVLPWVDEHGHLTHAFRWWQHGEVLGGGAGSRLTVYFWNRTTGAWEEKFTHLRPDLLAIDCSGTGCAGGNWGPCYELQTPGSCDPAVCPPPLLTREIGYEAVTRWYDGTPGLLLPGEVSGTQLSDSRIATWKVHSTTAHRSHFAGVMTKPQIACRSDYTRWTGNRAVRWGGC